MAKKIKLIIGSTRQNRVGPAVATWVEKQAASAGVELEIVDLKQIDLPPFDAPIPPMAAAVDTEAAQAWAKIIGEAEGFIFLTPEYNRSIPSSLKNAIDYLAAEWKNKIAVIVSYGYIDGGQSAMRHLKDIFELHKLAIIEPTVAVQLAQDHFDETGAFKDLDAALAHATEDLQAALKQLV